LTILVRQWSSGRKGVDEVAFGACVLAMNIDRLSAATINPCGASIWNELRRL